MAVQGIPNGVGVSDRHLRQWFVLGRAQAQLPGRGDLVRHPWWLTRWGCWRCRGKGERVLRIGPGCMRLSSQRIPLQERRGEAGPDGRRLERDGVDGACRACHAKRSNPGDAGDAPANAPVASHVAGIARRRHVSRGPVSQLSKTKRHLDGMAQARFWELLDEWVATHKPRLRAK